LVKPNRGQVRSSQLKVTPRSSPVRSLSRQGQIRSGQVSSDKVRSYFRLNFRLKKNATEDTAMICAAYAENAASYAICKRWYQSCDVKAMSIPIRSG